MKAIMGIDASYTRTGLAVSIDGKLEVIRSIKFKGLKTKPEKRKLLREKVQRYIDKYNPEMIIIERTRMFSANDKPFVAMNMIKTGVSLQTTIIDVAHENGIKVYSVDTRAWKSAVIGTSKPRGGDRKLPTIEYIESLGFDVYGDDDAADAGAISLFYWKAKSKHGEARRDELLRLEE